MEKRPSPSRHNQSPRKRKDRRTMKKYGLYLDQEELKRSAAEAAAKGYPQSSEIRASDTAASTPSESQTSNTLLPIAPSESSPDYDYSDEANDEEPLEDDNDTDYEDVIDEDETTTRNYETMHMLNQRVFSMGPSKASLGEALLGLCSLHKRHKISKKLLGDLIEYVYSLMSADTVFPRSKYMFYKFMEDIAPKESSTVTYFCAQCNFTYGERDKDKCPRCDKLGSNVLLKTNLSQKIKQMFEKKGLASRMDEYKTERLKLNEKDAGANITDIIDGAVYKSIKNRGSYDLSFIFNTDGFPISRSSKTQVWPLLLLIAEINPKLRPYFMLLHSLLYAAGKPLMSKYIIPTIADDMEELGVSGVDWIHPVTKEQINSKCFIICLCVDAQARYGLQGLTPYNSPNGCSTCEIPGERVPSGDGTSHIYAYSEANYTMRSSENMCQNAHEASKMIITSADMKRVCKGVVAFSQMALLENFDLGKGVSPEVLHSAYLGEVRRKLYKMTDSKFSSEDFSIVKFSELISKMLVSFTPPSTFRRLPRALTEVKHWKGSEFFRWIDSYSLPCLEKYWPSEYLDHHSLLVFGLHTLSKDKITEDDIIKAERALREYCRDYESKYKKEDQTFNLHMILHYASSVKNLGPLWSHSAFNFEAENFKLGTSIHGKGPVIAKELEHTLAIHNFGASLNFLYDQSNYKRTAQVEFLGALIPEDQLKQDIKEFIVINRHIFQSDDADLMIKIFKRVMINNTIYTSTEYSCATRTKSHFALCMDNNEKIAVKILHFLDVGGKQSLILCKRLDDLGPKYSSSLSNIFVEHIRLCEELNDMQLVDMDKVMCPLFVMENIGLDENETVYHIPANMIQINM